ncbi:hypothetical protein ABZ442_17085 [Streptomyces triculaminicus]|uniref:hypothetical protein n=1 Tax=Streptomyces triculaminicus TaxID=2816232 RepID=UPI0033F544C4
MSRLANIGRTAAVAATVGALALTATGTAHAVGVNASSADARFTGSYYVTNEKVKIYGTLKDFGAHRGQSQAFVRIKSTEGNYNHKLSPAVDNRTSRTYTDAAPYGGTFLSGTLTVCSWVNSGGGSVWKCGTPVGIYK